MIKRILVPVDFSEGGREALRYAAMLAEKLDAAVQVLHVWEPSPYVAPTQLVWIGGTARSFWTHMSEELTHRLEKLVEETVPEARARIQAKVEAGYVAHSILEDLRSTPYDMVVMGTHGRTGLSHLVLGSVAERIVRHAPCPVLTIRVPARREKEMARERSKRDQAFPSLRGFDFDTPTRT